MHTHSAQCTLFNVHRPRSRFQWYAVYLSIMLPHIGCGMHFVQRKLNCFPWSGVIVYWYSLETHIENGAYLLGRMECGCSVCTTKSLSPPLSHCAVTILLPNISIVFTIWSRKRSTSLWISTNSWMDRCWARHRHIHHYGRCGITLNQ